VTLNNVDPYIKYFLEQHLILIVDPSASFGQTLVGTLMEMGAPTQKVLYSKKYEDAQRIIQEYKPQILITEYFIGQKFGLSLIDQQAKAVGETAKVSILITHNSASSAIAEAAEEQVDDYILKPFSMGQMKERLSAVIKRKMNPTSYSLKIRSGKKLLRDKQFEKAELEFLEAKKLTDKPTLAHYYVGYSKYLQKSFTTALDEFRGGRKLQPLHFKCLIGEFDSNFEQKKYEDAFQLIPTIMENYPISPKRLGSIIIATVFSNHHDQIPKYFEIFKLLDHKPPELMKVFSAGLMTAGKYQVKMNNQEKAVACFEMGVSVIGADVSYLDQVIRELLKIGAAEQAAQFLSKFPSTEFGSASYLRLGFLIDRFLLPAHQVIEKGKKLVSLGYACSDSFLTLIDLALANNKIVLAEDIAAKAVLTHPDLRSKIYKKIEDRKLELENKAS